MMAAMAAEVIIRPACAARHRSAQERPAKKSAGEPTGDGPDRTSDHQTRACDQSFSRTGAVSSFDSSGAGASSADALLADKKLRPLSISGAKWSQARSIFR